MRIPLSWLRDYVDFNVDAQTLAHDLTMSGTKIEAVHAPAPEWQGVQVGRVLESGQHPNADKLSVCRVDVGGEELRIVCGAPNVRAGLTVAVATVGARLPGGVKIRKSKIRGEVSQGMICSARELGLGTDAAGILELDSALESGAPFTGVPGSDETVLEAEITPNRPDCLGLIGVAREVAAVYGTPLKRPPVWSEAVAEPAPVRIELADVQDGLRYLGRAIRDVEVGPSPAWMQARLASMQLEPINNVVDVTNYVLFETGQPIHAFDLAAVRGDRIIVRRARAGEKLRTLDGVDRELDPDILVIADAEGPVALAGIMGGVESAIQPSTRDVFLEVAHFRADLVRSGRRKLAIDTDASYRFERGTDAASVRWVADRATQLLLEVCGGAVREQHDDAYPRPLAPIRLHLRSARANRLIGTELGAAEMARLLQRLQLEAEPAEAGVDVEVPTFRRDLQAEIDLVEEVARVHGYDNIPEDVLPPAPLMQRPNARHEFLTRLRHTLVGLGYREVLTSAFMDRSDPDRLQLASDDVRRRVVRVRNPLVASLDTLRTSLVPNVVRVVRHNIHHGSAALRLFAVDRVYVAVEDSSEGLPQESERLVAVACGARRPEGWAETLQASDLFDLKGDAEALLEHLGVDSVWSAGYTEPFLDFAASFMISGSYGTVGGGGLVAEEVLRAYDVDTPVFLLDLDVDALVRHLPERRVFKGIPRFPAVKRDLSLVVPRRVAYEKVHAAVVGAGGPLLESINCFDVFEDRALGEDKHSIGLRLRFRSPERTLTDDVVDRQIDAIVRRLSETLGVELRRL
ncbi:MAG: phenylalanine--tRNA ligase subunit beta [Candidatus Latescibacterota bacterium]|nr:MAG: phenylalanine--tRNA ligase subunit beta [Candidatus Latescibacterota bacterium]